MNNLCFVLDTNILVLAVSRRTNYRLIFDKLVDGAFEIAVSTEILLEYEEKLNNFYDKKTTENILTVLSLLPNVKRIEPKYNLLLIKNDYDDDKFVDCAFASNSNGIVTNDKHFNILKTVNFPKINLLKIDDFMRLIIQL